MNRPTIDEIVTASSDSAGTWHLYADHVESWAWQQDIFTKDELDEIIRIGEAIKLDQSKLLNPYGDDKIRNSRSRFIFPNQVTGWIFARLTDSAITINDKYFKFDLRSFDQGLQFTKYSAPDQHYDWHVDRAHQRPTRKLSLSLQLSDPSTYDGGDLQLKFNHDEITVQRTRGVATFFPSYTLHRVTPVTRGTRYSLVAWISGPPFK